jgi:energy-coupling factor transporter transmembrane protein EcfT
MSIWFPLVALSSLTLAYQGGLIWGTSTVGTLSILGVSVPYSKAGFIYGITMVFRGTNIALAALGIVWTTHPRDIVYALTNSFRIPYKMSWAVFLGLIYTPIIAYESQVVSHAHIVRGIKMNRWNPFQKEIITKYFFPVLVRGLRRGSLTAIAMEGRAFGTYSSRTFRHTISSSTKSKVFAICSIAAAVVYVILFFNYMAWDPSSIIKTAGAV